MVKFPSYFFKEHEKLCGSSNFVAWKFRLEIIANQNDVLDITQGRLPDPLENTSVAVKKKKHKKCELEENKIIVDGLQDIILAYVGNLRRYKKIMIR